MIDIVRACDRSRLVGLLRGGWDPPQDVIDAVRAILARVRAEGDDALVAYTRHFDYAQFAQERLRVPIPALETARELVPEAVARALELAKERVEDFHRRQMREDVAYTTEDGTHYGWCFRPLDAIAAYVPGGSAPLPSSVVMNVVPAKVAGVARTIVLTPPQKDGNVHPAVLFAASLCGADELYAVGGAHAIGAAAYGTETIAPVDKIVGPGNTWVTEAKRQVFGICAIDGLAGPSEVLVVADEGARVEYVVGELLAQAEHDPLARVAVVSQSRELLDACARSLADIDIAALPRGDIIAASLRGCSLIEAATRDEVFAIVDAFAPEHLSLQVRNPREYLDRIRHAGAVFAGDMTPVACGDYVAGSNHVLPTSGAARFSSGLSTAEFLRAFSVVEYSDARLRADAPLLEALASFEGLHQHARTARIRAKAGDASV